MMTEQQAAQFMRKVDTTAPFWVELDKFQITDTAKMININGVDWPICLYNLVVSRRDVNLWKMGIKPTRSWQITKVKKYFGIKGNKDRIAEQIETMCNEFISQQPAQD
jgi:hypothetical protein